MLHEVQMYSQITPMEIDILFKLAECRHPDGFDLFSFWSDFVFVDMCAYTVCGVMV